MILNNTPKRHLSSDEKHTLKVLKLAEGVKRFALFPTQVKDTYGKPVQIWLQTYWLYGEAEYDPKTEEISMWSKARDTFIPFTFTTLEKDDANIYLCPKGHKHSKISGQKARELIEKCKARFS